MGSQELSALCAMLCLVAQECPTLCDPLDCSSPGSSVHGISQARILNWVSIPSSGDLPDPGIKPMSSVSPVLQVDSLPLSHRGSPFHESKKARKRRRREEQRSGDMEPT